MIVTTRLDFDEALRRKVRAAHGRGGMATRSEIRTWLDGVTRAALARLPEPKVRRAKPVASVDRPDALARASTPETRCRFCGSIKDEHGKMMLSCPAPFRTRFGPELT